MDKISLVVATTRASLGRMAMTPCPVHEASLAGGRPVIGVDEVGRGPLAGPVVAAAAFLPLGHGIEGLRDSKALTERQRNLLVPLIMQRAVVALGGVSAADIDRIGIGPATTLAMRRAVQRLERWGRPTGAIALVDGNYAPDLGDIDVITEVKADGSCPSVAAASILAKVVRDRAMSRLAPRYGAFGWHTNKGYGSKQHREAILRAGITAHHRRSFLGKILG